MNVKEHPEDISNNLQRLIEKFKLEAEALSNENAVSVEIKSGSIGCCSEPIPEGNWQWKSDGTSVNQPLGEKLVKGPMIYEMVIRYSPKKTYVENP